MLDPNQGQALAKAAEGLSWKAVEAKTAAVVPTFDTAALGKAAQNVANWASHAPQVVQKQLAAVLASIPVELQPFALALAVPATFLILVVGLSAKGGLLNKAATVSPYPNQVVPPSCSAPCICFPPVWFP
jgi:hypothetical protein